MTSKRPSSKPRSSSNNEPNNLLIQGNFEPEKTQKWLGSLNKLFFLGLAILMMTSIILYGITVQIKSNINLTSKENRELDEENKELQVKLDRIRSFKNIEASAQKLLYLNEPVAVIHVKSRNTKPLTPPPELKPTHLIKYGY